MVEERGACSGARLRSGCDGAQAEPRATHVVLEALLRRRAVALAAAEPDVDSLAESMGPLLSLRLGARLLARAALYLLLLLKGLSFDAAVRPLLPRPAPCAPARHALGSCGAGR